MTATMPMRPTLLRQVEPSATATEKVARCIRMESTAVRLRRADWRRALGWTQSHCNRVWKGRQIVIDDLEQLSELFGVTVTWLLREYLNDDR